MISKIIEMHQILLRSGYSIEEADAIVSKFIENESQKKELNIIENSKK